MLLRWSSGKAVAIYAISEITAFFCDAAKGYEAGHVAFLRIMRGTSRAWGRYSEGTPCIKLAGNALIAIGGLQMKAPDERASGLPAGMPIGVK